MKICIALKLALCCFVTLAAMPAAMQREVLAQDQREFAAPTAQGGLIESRDGTMPSSPSAINLNETIERAILNYLPLSELRNESRHSISGLADTAFYWDVTGGVIATFSSAGATCSLNANRTHITCPRGVTNLTFTWQSVQPLSAQRFWIVQRFTTSWSGPYSSIRRNISLAYPDVWIHSSSTPTPTAQSQGALQWIHESVAQFDSVSVFVDPRSQGENSIANRVYLNQRALAPAGDSKCSVATMAMLLAMNGLLGSDYADLAARANDMYPRVLNKNGDAEIGRMAAELRRQNMDASARLYSADAAWSTIKDEVNAGRPVIVRTQHGVVTRSGHFFVAVGYRSLDEGHQVIAYDPYGVWNGTCCTNNYDRNARDPNSVKGRFVLYDFDKAFGASNWLVTGRSQQSVPLQASAAPPPPDPFVPEPEDVGTYEGIRIFADAAFLPVTLR